MFMSTAVYHITMQNVVLLVVAALSAVYAMQVLGGIAQLVTFVLSGVIAAGAVVLMWRAR